ncbi:MAG: GEVED domain-containing protein [Thermoguttaceae bacterium]
MPDGEVEDYRVSIIAAQEDFGDAPGSQTARSDNGARHTIVDGFHLGSLVDFENDGTPQAGANWDDTHGVDDEDGVEIVGDLRTGYTSTITVTAAIPATIAHAYLNAWLDFNNDGDFDDSGEKLVFLPRDGVSNPSELTNGANTLSFNVPETLPDGQLITTRNVAARFRLSDTLDLGPTTPAAAEQGPVGEVEDYMWQVLAGESSISGHAFLDLNGDGEWQDSPDKVGSMAVPTPQRQGAGSGQRVLSGTDDYTWLQFGFGFDYFGSRYTGCYINANGTISFGPPVTSGTPADSDVPMIAPFWSDVDMTSVGSVSVQNGTSSRGNLFVQIDWFGVGRTVDNRTNTFSLYLENDPNGDIVAFFYDTMSWAAPTDDGTTASWIGFDPGAGESFVTFPQPADLSKLRSAGSVPTYAFRTDPTTGKLVGQESGLEGFTIYLDMDNSGTYTPADKVTTTDATGYYQFAGLFPGDTYLVGEVPPQDPNWQLTKPLVPPVGTYTYTFPPNTNEQITGYDFGYRHISQLSVQDVVVTEGNSGTTQVEVTLELTDTYGGPVTVNYSTQNGTAQANQDYPSASGTFTIPAHGVPAPVWTKQTLTEDAGNDFSYQIVGNLVLWEGYDGHDRELFLYDGAVVHQLTSNAVDDRYATIVQGTGGAWTVYWSQFDGNDYEILAKHYSGTGTPEAVQDVALTNNTFDDKSPQASDTFVTWLGTTTNGSELFVAKVDDTTVWQLTRNTRPDYEPQISGKCIVWSGGTGNNQEIYLWDGSIWTNTATDPSSYIQPLTNNARVDQWPKIDDNLVVWEGFDGEDSEIYMYQIGGSLAPVQVTQDDDGTADTQPQVSGNMIVWTRTSPPGTTDIYGYDDDDPEIACYDASNWYDATNQVAFDWTDPWSPNRLTYNTVADESPRIYNGNLVWHRQVGSSPVNYDVFYRHRELTTWSIETNISSAPAYDWYPQVSDEYVVWRNYNGTDYEIVIARQTQPTVKAKLTLVINGDTNVESDESFFVNFTSADGANLINTQAKVTILNDDGQMDYGDAPSSYPTLLGQNGARHVIKTGMSLGSRVDSESNGQPSAQATGDDTQQYDDEDGVVFNTSLTSGTTAQITVTATLPTDVPTGYLDAWIDFNGDGRWTDSEKLVFNNYTGLQAGTNVLTFSVPTTAKAGTVAARFRLSSTGGLAPTGTALDGEVEDYMVAVAKGTSLVINNRTLTVTGTDLDDVFSVTTGATVEVTLNGETTQFNAASLDRIVFDGKGGRNQATVIGTTADETIVASPGSATLTRTGLEVLLSSAQVIAIDGNGGDDTATINGTSADESALTGPQWATLTSGTDRVAVSHVPTIVIDGAGGSDVISMLDSSGDDTVDAKSGTFTMTDAVASYSIEAKSFEAGTAYARAGGNDKAYLHGTTENDHYFGSPESGTLFASSFRYRANGFDQLFVYGNGGQDGATLEGSEYNDTFEAHPQDGWSSLSGPNYSHRLESFQSIDVYGGRGTDTAKLYGTSGVNTFLGTPAQAVLSTQGFAARVNHFRSVQAFAGSGTNLAYLLGSLGDDYFTGSKARSRLYGQGYELIAEGFDQVLAYGGQGGYDRAVLDGSSGNDRLTARDGQATVEFDLSELITVDDFDWVEAKDSNSPRKNTASVQDEAIDFILKRDAWL